MKIRISQRIAAIYLLILLYEEKHKHYITLNRLTEYLNNISNDTEWNARYGITEVEIKYDLPSLVNGFDKKPIFSLIDDLIIFNGGINIDELRYNEFGNLSNEVLWALCNAKAYKPILLNNR